MIYTRGEWKIREHGVTYEIYVETPNKPRAKEYQVAEGIYNKANARLISAAPDMYEACKSLIASYIFHCPEARNESEAIKKGEAALAKAEGK